MKHWQLIVEWQKVLTYVNDAVISPHGFVFFCLNSLVHNNGVTLTGCVMEGCPSKWAFKSSPPHTADGCLSLLPALLWAPGHQYYSASIPRQCL